MYTICKIRDLQRVINEFEDKLIKEKNLSLKEAIILCSLTKNDSMTSSQLANELDMTYSNCSKVLRSVEEKGLINRHLGKKDRRNMIFSISKKGIGTLDLVKTGKIQLPDLLNKAVESI
ncbi:MAG: MarR family winged helix-turn-helix transcriptional regulator [Bacteroidales bacterium]